jgi:hypothetical protein
MFILNLVLLVLIEFLGAIQRVCRCECAEYDPLVHRCQLRAAPAHRVKSSEVRGWCGGCSPFRQVCVLQFTVWSSPPTVEFARVLQLKKLNYTGQTTTGEMSGTQAVDFHTLGHDFFPAGSAQRLWLDAYAKGVGRFVKRAKAQGLKAYFFVDLIVLPTFVLDAWPNATSGGKVLWNAATRQLIQILVDETFARFPECDGWIVRTGET